MKKRRKMGMIEVVVASKDMITVNEEILIEVDLEDLIVQAEITEMVAMIDSKTTERVDINDLIVTIIEETIEMEEIIEIIAIEGGTEMKEIITLEEDDNLFNCN